MKEQNREDLRNATYLIEALAEYKDSHSKELRSIFISFVENPKQDIRRMLREAKTEPKKAYCFSYNTSTNIALAEIEYPV